MTDFDRQQINAYIVQLSHGSESALDGLAQLLSGRMLSVALAVVKNRALAEDVVQDSFVRILQKASSFKSDTNGYAWICKIVQNVVLNVLCKEKRFRTQNIDDFPFICADVSVEEQGAASVAINEAMQNLTDTEKWLVYQKYFMDFTVRDSAKSVGKSKSAVQRILAQAEEKIRRNLSVT